MSKDPRVFPDGGPTHRAPAPHLRVSGDVRPRPPAPEREDATAALAVHRERPAGLTPADAPGGLTPAALLSWFRKLSAKSPSIPATALVRRPPDAWLAQRLPTLLDGLDHVHRRRPVRTAPAGSAAASLGSPSSRSPPNPPAPTGRSTAVASAPPPPRRGCRLPPPRWSCQRSPTTRPLRTRASRSRPCNPRPPACCRPR